MKIVATAIKIFLVFTLLTGVLYPLLITGIAQLAFPAKANGSLIKQGGKTVGSERIGQQFDTMIYFTSRPSAIRYQPMPSGGSNLGLTSNQLKTIAATRRAQFIEYNHLDSLTVVPAEMIFSSASGLDPQISPAAALLQVDRISGARKFNDGQKQQLIRGIQQLTEPPQFSFLGQERVNVLLLNLYADQIK